MGLFDSDRGVENADLDCSPQNDYVSEKTVAKIDDVVDEGEHIHFLAKEAGGGIDVEGSSAGSSLFGDDRSRKIGTVGFVRTAATDKRVLVKVPQMLGSDERSIPYRSITSVDLDLGHCTSGCRCKRRGRPTTSISGAFRRVPRGRWPGS